VITQVTRGRSLLQLNTITGIEYKFHEYCPEIRLLIFCYYYFIDLLLMSLFVILPFYVIISSLENHSLSEKLGLLLSDKDHLYKCYNPEAFLRQKEYSDAALLCLRAVELNQPSLLLEINPKLVSHFLIDY